MDGRWWPGSGVLALCAVAISWSTVARAGDAAIAVMPSDFGGDGAGISSKLFDEAVLSASQNILGVRVIGQDDVNQLLSLEAQKDLLGCEDTTCFAEIGGALGVPRLLAFHVARVGESWAVNGKLIDTAEISVIARISEFIDGDGAALLKATPEIVRRLLSGGGLSFDELGVFARRGPRDPEEERARLLFAQMGKERLIGEIEAMTESMWPGTSVDSSDPEARELELAYFELARRRLSKLVTETTTEERERQFALCDAVPAAPACRAATYLEILGGEEKVASERCGKAFLKACVAGDAEMCNEVRVLATVLNVAPRNRDIGRGLLMEICLVHDSSICQVPRAYNTGAVRSAIRRHCDHGNPRACSYAVEKRMEGGRQQRGWGITLVVAGVNLAAIGVFVSYVACQNDPSASCAPDNQYPPGAWAAGVGAGILFGAAAASTITGILLLIDGYGGERGRMRDLAAQFEETSHDTAPTGSLLLYPTFVGDRSTVGPGVGMRWAL